MIANLYPKALELLKAMIATPSYSGNEEQVCKLVRGFLTEHGVEYQTHLHNTWAIHPDYNAAKPTILLNSHIDTVKPTAGWIYDPFTPTMQDGKLIGLGSNDAGGPLVSLIATFVHFWGANALPYNLILSATAEEENSGANGVESILKRLPPIDLAIVGEPTCMKMAIAERGLLVLDCKAHGKSGHAARNEGINALYQALPDIEWFRSFNYPNTSPLLGEVKMTVTQIRSGYQHNVVPDLCEFVVDVRTNECYSNRQVLKIVKENVKCDVKARSLRLNSSSVPINHPIVALGKLLDMNTYGSPTCSDMAIMPYPSVKIGPGDSARSHTPNEYIYPEEIERGIELYIKLLQGLTM
jgi:acetylornithine deacetylase